MSEYDKKIEEVKALCKWFNEHAGEVEDRDNVVLMAAAYGPKGSRHITSVGIGQFEDVLAVLDHLRDRSLLQRIKNNWFN